MFRRKKKSDIDLRLRELNLIINIMRDNNTGEALKQQLIESSKNSVTCKGIRAKKLFKVRRRNKKF